jgi:hypothetical protein
MPLERLRAAAAEAASLPRRLGPDAEAEAASAGAPAEAEEDALARALLTWFKTEFFTWVSAPPRSAYPHTGHVRAAPARPLVQGP